MKVTSGSTLYLSSLVVGLLGVAILEYEFKWDVGSDLALDWMGISLGIALIIVATAVVVLSAILRRRHRKTTN
jgi:hypothetical protein